MAELKNATIYMPNLFIGIFLYIRFRFQRLLKRPSCIVIMVNRIDDDVFFFQCVPFKKKDMVLFYSRLDKSTANNLAMKIQQLTHFIKD